MNEIDTEGFLPIAVRDDPSGNTVVSYSPERNEFIVTISGKRLGPVNLNEVRALRENLSDVIEMQGRYLFIKEYDVDGAKTEPD